jgi:hypothetical protein
MSDISDAAEASYPTPPHDVSQDEAAGMLWRMFREMVPELSMAPAQEWTAALGALLDRPRPRHQRCRSALYADDAHCAGWVFAVLIRALSRVLEGRRAGLTESPEKCAILADAASRPVLDVILAPLRRGNERAWRVVEEATVLGVPFADPAEPERIAAAVAERLQQRVVQPIGRLNDEIAAGAKRSTALFVLRRFVLPAARYIQQAWGLLLPRSAWEPAVVAVDDFCAALCPLDLRGLLARDPGGGPSPLRCELALSQACGGLGVPLLADEAPFYAAAVWQRDDARAVGVSDALLGAHYTRDRGLLGTGRWLPVSVADYHRSLQASLPVPADRRDRQLCLRRREVNALRGGMRAFGAVPWDADYALDNLEWDLAWRLVFGGMSRALLGRIDHPRDGFAARGKDVEVALAAAIRDVLPGAPRIAMQPEPEVYPARGPFASAAPDEANVRADLEVSFRRGGRHVIDVSAVNVLSASACERRASAAAHLRAVERAKWSRYGSLYSHFRPLAISLSGAVSEDSFQALKGLAREAARSAESVMEWEPDVWASAMLHRLAVAVVRATCSAIRRTRSCVPLPASSDVMPLKSTAGVAAATSARTTDLTRPDLGRTVLARRELHEGNLTSSETVRRPGQSPLPAAVDGGGAVL